MKSQVLSIFLVILFAIPLSVFADGGLIHWPPDVYLDESAQNAIVAWNGREEILIISNDLQSSTSTLVLRMIPLPSNPSEIKEGNFEVFEKLVKIMNEKIQDIRNQGGYPGIFEGSKEGISPGIQITFHQQIGAHDITVVEVNNLDDFLNWIEKFAKNKNLKNIEISPKFREGVENYLKRDINYFVFDVINLSGTEESINPIIYKFRSGYLYYPLRITAVSDVGSSYGRVELFLIAKDFVDKGFVNKFPVEVELSHQELEEISKDVANLFAGGVKLIKIGHYGKFSASLAKDDIVVPSNSWNRDLSIGDSGRDVKLLQQLLINEGVWASSLGATGYFGPLTQEALAKYQEKFRSFILEPLGLKKGTGYFGKKTREFLERTAVVPEENQEMKLNRNLYLGTRGKDVEILQGILIKEGCWNSKIQPSGYFGPVTYQAVIAFQEKYSSEILEPLGLNKGTGFVGPLTRSYLNKILSK
ncbi:DUF2330 domain-containing protein [bacterium]|nr:DUF2330 domain-containing protein [bacterium]